MIKALLALALLTGVASAQEQKPRLILQITVDQLRGDLPEKYMKHMTQGGFRYLKEKGTWYKSAYYQHSVTQTAVGHTTLATGAYPSEHGMISNAWYDRKTKSKMYNVQDKSTHILRFNESEESSKNSDGRSPKNILVSTFSDELRLFTNKKAKVFAVSVKDRGAVTLGGHDGKAFWFDKSTGEFVSSSYYYDSYPSWVKTYNKHKTNTTLSNKAWELSMPLSEYIYKDEKKGEINYAGFGTTFPHQYGTKEDKYFNSRIAFSPAGYELTLAFAKELLKAEKLGKDKITDFLAISFSATDYVGHVFGPSSVEAEENLLRLDKTLANLFSFIDKEVGLKNTLIVLYADHGAPETPSHLHELHLKSEQVYTIGLSADERALKKLSIDKSLIEAFELPYLYLNYDEIKKRGLHVEDVALDISTKLKKLEGIEEAIISTKLINNQLPDTYLNRSALKNFNKERSGDILLINKPLYVMNSKTSKVACNHGSPWKYDTFVPVIFAGYNIEHKEVYRNIEPNDIAPTLSAIVGAKTPSNASGKVLKEVLF